MKIFFAPTQTDIPDIPTFLKPDFLFFRLFLSFRVIPVFRNTHWIFFCDLFFNIEKLTFLKFYSKNVVDTKKKNYEKFEVQDLDLS